MGSRRLSPIVAYVAEAPITLDSGMGRIAWHWKLAFEASGWTFVEISPAQTGWVPHKSLFDVKAFYVARRRQIKPACFLVHEPASAIFCRSGISTVVFSHGIEERGRSLCSKLPQGRGGIRQLLTRSLWARRERSARLGLQRGGLLLLSNSEDEAFVLSRYGRNPEDVYIFRNGCDELASKHDIISDVPTVLFIGTWIPRKGIASLVRAAQRLHRMDVKVRWLLAGTGCSVEEVLLSWPDALRESVTVIPQFTRAVEEQLFQQATIFVLPSVFEGQPLSLLQAMRNSMCCITTNSCGQRDLVTSGENGLLHEVGDTDRLASLLHDCVTNPTYAAELGHRAMCSVADRAWSVVAGEVASKVMNFTQNTRGA